MAYKVIPFGQARSGDQGSISNHSARQDILSPYPYLPLSDPERRIRILHLDAAEQHAAPLCGHFEEEFITRPDPAAFDDPSSHNYKVHDKWCSQCGTRIHGARHKCVVCDDLDYCTTCIANASDTHPNHDFELIEALQTYEALSYSWGGAFDDDDLADGTIVISGHTVPIRGNLFNALRRLRYPDQARRLWVDALCINQDDIPERNGQVQSMETVYSNCAKVLVWLGEDTEILDGELIFTLATILDQLRTLEPTPGSTEPTTEELSAEIETLKAEYSALYSAGQIRVREQLNEAINSNAEVNAQCCEAFLARRYFSRRWVVQEVYWARASGRPAEVLCGSLQSNWDSIAATMRLIGHLVGGIADEEHMLLSLPLLLSRPTPQPMEVLKLFNHLGCSEPRDRIFALVSLCSGQTVDYNRSCEEVYTEFAAEVAMDETLYKWEQLLWLAAYQASSPLRKPETELPSWVPDWRLELPGGWSMMPVDHGIEGYLHSAGVTWKPPVCLNMDVFGQIEILDGNNTTRQIRLLLDPGPQHSSSRPYRVAQYNSGNDTLVAGRLQSGDLLCGPLCQQKDAARGRSAIVLRPSGYSEEFIAQIPYERDGGDFRRDRFSGMQPVCKVVGLYGIDIFGDPCPTPYRMCMIIR
ncbi:hypothetical protein CKM354_000486000 [Cercospora kikuchii]|uniref:ZZ-type domain-containing protein n=1 Tax=Cercospora kikuchii TaxID=84275 RepID=A0A9P3CKS5_9PEZI|nr:uncharacterized protein CKM354_000486000 [Cercospora kikuchii]GIZ41560.1 hypothetical protein CKM354_000486000 [Cercospora kikuchii]